MVLNVAAVLGCPQFAQLLNYSPIYATIRNSVAFRQPPTIQKVPSLISPTDAALVAQWERETAPLLPLLHAFHDRDGYLSEEALKAVSTGLKIPLAELFATVTFYHHFARQAPGQSAPRVCTGPICALRGAGRALRQSRRRHAHAMRRSL